jgi:hypothetical protein
MNVIRHDQIAIHAHLELAAHSLQPLQTCASPLHPRRTLGDDRCGGDKVSLSRFLKSLQAPRHTPSLGPNPSPLKPTPGLNGPPASFPLRLIASTVLSIVRLIFSPLQARRRHE